MRWLLYLLLYIPIQLFAYLITPLLPLFVRSEYGLIDNANGWTVEPRLTGWFEIFGTYDNSLLGDDNWKASHDGGYWSMVAWLYRNSFYYGKLKLFGMPVQSTRKMIGNPQIDYHSKTFGTMRITQPNGAWQYKCVRPFMGKTLVLNFGWLLDDVSQERALFMCSPRLK
jgi:hypothetical protein